MPSERYAIAQVTPFPWEDAHEVTTFVRETSTELARRGHRVVVLAPSSSSELVRDSRRLIRSARDDPDTLWDPDGGVRVLGVGELLSVVTSRRAQAPAPPIDIARTIEEVLTHLPFDFVHVHEPFAPSASSVALRHSRALNVGSFHAPTERVVSTQVARRFVELFFGRLDVRTAAFQTTAQLLKRFFPAEYHVIAPGAHLTHRRGTSDGRPVSIAFSDVEDRGGLRLFIRALRRLDPELPWTATISSPTGVAPVQALRRSVRERVSVVATEERSEAEIFDEADIVVAASIGQTPSPGLLLRAIGAGAVPVASDVAAYRDVLLDGTYGLQFDGGDPDTLAAQLTRLIADPSLRHRLLTSADERRATLGWAHVTDRVEELYTRTASRRHTGRERPDVAKRLEGRKLIDVDLHMHTDHSGDCATPVEVLLATARDQGLGAIAVTDHNEISGALDAAAKAAEYGVKVIVAEEVKTAEQGEVIGLFIREKIPRGLTLEETIAEIKRQGGLVYVPHPFDRLHSVPDYEHLLAVLEDIDALEIFNPRVAISAFNEEAVRFAAKYRIVAGAGSDAHVAQGLGSVRIRMRDFDGPEEFLESLREADIIRRPTSLLYVQALKFLQTKATPAGARRAARERKVRRAVSSRDK